MSVSKHSDYWLYDVFLSGQVDSLELSMYGTFHLIWLSIVGCLNKILVQTDFLHFSTDIPYTLESFIFSCFLDASPNQKVNRI